MKEDIEGSHFVIILGHKYIKNRKLRKIKEKEMFVVYQNIIKYAFDPICTKRSQNYEGRTESHEQLFFACELGTADERECGGRWNQLLCYP